MATVWIVLCVSCLFLTNSLCTDLNKLEWDSYQMNIYEQVLKLQREVEQLRRENKEIGEILITTKNNSRSCICKRTPFDCSDIYKNGEKKSGIYKIYPFGENSHGISVLCRMDSEFGGRTVIQHRDDKSPRINFNATWEEYKQGFGNVREQYWLGNEVIHKLTTTFEYDLHINMWACVVDNLCFTFVAEYSSFSISGEADGYRLFLGKESGNASDAFRDPTCNIVNQPFFTFDHDNEHRCAYRMASGWWFNENNNCASANLNAPRSVVKFGNLSFHVHQYVLPFSEMIIGRRN
ncbi:fibrinogen-like protein 1 [Saccostrea cucullata]|uniref:fibrinogen-like protein 1 n=1 Tax=Saccostrea cuccullata TaxID=36930 RepID=UPI002ED4B531